MLGSTPMAGARWSMPAGQFCMPAPTRRRHWPALRDVPAPHPAAAQPVRATLENLCFARVAARSGLRMVRSNIGPRAVATPDRPADTGSLRTGDGHRGTQEKSIWRNREFLLLWLAQ